MWFSTSSVLAPDARLILSSFPFLLKKYEFSKKLSSDGYVVYLWTVTEVDYASQQGKKWRHDFSYGNMSKLRVLCVHRDQVLKLSVDFLRDTWCLVLFSQPTTPQQSPSYSQKKWTSFCNEPCGNLSTVGESNMEMYREQKKASEVESIEVMEVRRFWGIENRKEGDSRRKLRRKKDWEHSH